MKEVGYTAEAAVRRVVVHRVAVHRVAVRKAVVHMIVGLVVDSMALVAPGQDKEIGHMKTEAVGLEAAGEACCSQTVLGDKVMTMCRRERAVVNRETVVVHLNQCAGA